MSVGAYTSSLHIPSGINYDCTGCGKCCSGWTVPLTQTDYDRISPVDWGALLPKVAGRQSFVKMNKYEQEGTPYTHKIVDTGRLGTCPFLVDNLCFIHGQRGSEFKPTMCQLFPYRFMETPSGVYTTVSFVSMATIYNTGKPLVEQQEWLDQKWAQFQRLYPDFHPDWSAIKLAVGLPMTWDQYKDHDDFLLSIITDESIPVRERLSRGSAYLYGKVKSSQAEATAAPLSPEARGDESKLNSMDRAMMRHLHDVYFPFKQQKRGEQNFQIMGFLANRFLDGTELNFANGPKSFKALNAVSFPEDDPEIENLLARYLYSMIFSKTYFGPGFGHVSLVSGFNHLIMIYALAKLHARGVALLRNAPVVSFIDMVATIKQLETQLGETKIGPYGAALWELVLGSSSRARRMLEFAG